MAQRASLVGGPFMLPRVHYLTRTLRHDTQALLRAATALLRGAAGLLSSATLRRSASMRLITRYGGANGCLRS